jgi:hypothetical protein
VTGSFLCAVGSRVCRRRADGNSTDEATPSAPVTRRVGRNEVVSAGGDDFVVDVRRGRRDGESDADADAAPQPDVDVVTEDEPCADMEDVGVPDAEETDAAGKTRRRHRRPLFCLPLRLRVGANADGTPASVRVELPDRYTSRGVLPDDASVTLVPTGASARRLLLSGAATLRRTAAGGGCTTVTYDDAAGVVTGDDCAPAEYVVVTVAVSDAKTNRDDKPPVALIVGVVVGVGAAVALAAAALVVALKRHRRKDAKVSPRYAAADEPEEPKK